MTKYGGADTEELKEDGDIGVKGEAGGVESSTSSPLLPSNFSSFVGGTHLYFCGGSFG